MKRVLILIALLVLVAPSLSFAQGEVTIEGLNDKVHALAADLIILAKELDIPRGTITQWKQRYLDEEEFAERIDRLIDSEEED